MAFVPRIGRDASTRCAPRLSLAVGTTLGVRRLGAVGRSSSTFGRTLGLTQVQRWSLDAPSTTRVAGSSVRPPIDYWPFAEDAAATGADSRAAAQAPAPTPTPAQSSVSVSVKNPMSASAAKIEALKQLVKSKLQQGSLSTTPEANGSGSAAPVRRSVAPPGRRTNAPSMPVRRGLPSSMRRQGRTWAGAGTAPGRTATTSAPQATGSVPVSRVEPTRSQRGERGADGDGAKEDRRAGRTSRPRVVPADQVRRMLQANGVDVVPPVVAPAATALGRAIEPAQQPAARHRAPNLQRPVGAPQPTTQSLTTQSRTEESTPPVPPIQEAPAAATSGEHRSTSTPDGKAKTKAKDKAKDKAKGKAAATVADSVPPVETDPTGLRSVEDARSLDVERVTRAEPLPAALGEPIRRVADPLVSRSVDRPFDPSAEPIEPRTAVGDLSVGPARGIEREPETVRVDVLRPVPLATLARHPRRATSRPESPRPGSAPRGTPQTAVDRRGAAPIDSTAIGSATAPSPAPSTGTRSAPVLGGTPAPVLSGTSAPVLSGASAPVLLPMTARIGQAHRPNVRRSPDGRGIVWSDRSDAEPDLASGGSSAASVATSSAPTATTRARVAGTSTLMVARSLDRSGDPLDLTGAPSSDDDVAVGGLADALAVAPPPAGPLLTSAFVESRGVDTGSQSPAHSSRQQPTDRVQRMVGPSADWVTAGPGSLLGVNLLRRRRGSVNLAVGSLPSLTGTATVADSPSVAPADLAALAPGHIGVSRTIGERARVADDAEVSAARKAAEPRKAAGPRTASDARSAPDARSDDQAAPSAPRRRRELGQREAVAGAFEQLRLTDADADGDTGAAAVRPAVVTRADLGGNTLDVPASGSTSEADARLDRGARLTRDERLRPGTARAQATDLAERFLAELVRHRDERPTALPTVFRSIADLIVPDRQPLISTSNASRRALAVVGKSAATTGDVIHLADPGSLVAPSADLRAVIAHELTHVAHAAPEPRFFDDDRDSAEERRAHEVGEIMRTAPLVPKVIGASMTAQRSLAPTPTRPQPAPTGGGSSGGVSAADLAARLTGTASPDTIQRSPGSPRISTASSSASHIGSTSGTAVVQRAATEDESQSSTSSSTSMSADTFESLLRDHFDLIVDLLEERIIVDLERRGGRFRGDF